MMAQQFVNAVFLLAAAGRWAELTQFLALTAAIIAQPTMTVTTGQPVDTKK